MFVLFLPLACFSSAAIASFKAWPANVVILLTPCRIAAIFLGYFVYFGAVLIQTKMPKIQNIDGFFFGRWNYRYIIDRYPSLFYINQGLKYLIEVHLKRDLSTKVLFTLKLKDYLLEYTIDYSLKAAFYPKAKKIASGSVGCLFEY